MEKYRRVKKEKPETKDIEENEIRVTTSGKPRSFISYATSLFKEKSADTVVLKAMGRAITKTVTIAEIIKRRIPGLHQITVIDSTDIVDTWEPIEEGLDVIETTKHVSSIIITLSTKALDTKAPGYQAPLPEDEVKEITTFQKNTRSGGNRGRSNTNNKDSNVNESRQNKKGNEGRFNQNEGRFNQNEGRRGGFNSQVDRRRGGGRMNRPGGFNTQRGGGRRNFNNNNNNNNRNRNTNFRNNNNQINKRFNNSPQGGGQINRNRNNNNNFRGNNNNNNNRNNNQRNNNRNNNRGPGSGGGRSSFGGKNVKNIKGRGNRNNNDYENDDDVINEEDNQDDSGSDN